MLIILEGPDGAGKSTLAGAIADALEDAYPANQVLRYHKGPPARGVHPLDEYQRPLDGYRPNSGVHVVCDRWHVGEAVYPGVLGRSTRFDTAVARHTDAFLQARGAVLVHVRPIYEWNAKQLTRRGDDLITTSQLFAIRSGFAEYFERTHMRTYLVSDPRDTFHVSRIIAYAREVEAETLPLTRFVTYVGPRYPLYLLLGEVRHALRHSVPSERLGLAEQTRGLGPAFGPYPATSGHYLLNKLPGTLWQHGVGLANACDVDDIRELVSTICAGGHRVRVCALGRAAQRATVRARLAELSCVETLGAAPHPQFIRRFHHRDGFTYGAVIADALDYGKNMIDWRPGE